MEHMFPFKAYLRMQIDAVGAVGRYAREFGSRRGFPLWIDFEEDFLDYTLDLAQALKMDEEEAEELFWESWSEYEAYHYYVQMRMVLWDAMEKGCIVGRKGVKHVEVSP